MNTYIKYHSYLKEGYGANMDDEDWNTYPFVQFHQNEPTVPF